ncbi:hypothetical protein REPUB_Repub20aG0031400 [Reevesia pubescens]
MNSIRRGARNGEVKEQIKQSIDNVVLFAAKYVDEYESVQAVDVADIVRRATRDDVWNPPQSSFIKINFDGAIDKARGHSGIGAIIEILMEMYNNNLGAQPGVPIAPTNPQPNPFGNTFYGAGSGLIRGGLGAYGEKILGSSSEYVQSNISRYFSDPQYYFQVNDQYVRNKLKVVLLPFLHRGHWTRITEPVGGRLSYKPPIYDINAPDLYIPFMAFGTYFVLAGLSLGLQGKIYSLLFHYMFSVSPMHPEAGLCLPRQSGIFIGHLRQLFARLPLILTVLLLNWAGRRTDRKFPSKIKVLHGLPNLCPYAMGIRPVNPLWARLITAKLPNLTKLTGK